MAQTLCPSCRKLRYQTDLCLGEQPCPLKLKVGLLPGGAGTWVKPPKKESAGERIDEAGAATSAAPPRRRGRPLAGNPKSKRAAYQRELMRKKRAAKKGEATE